MANKKWLAAGLSVSVLASLSLVGCGGSTDTSAPASNGGSQIDAKQEITLNLGDEIPTLDVSMETDAISFDVIGNTNEGLVHLDKDGVTAKPGIAESWDISKDGLTYTFHLRKNAKWSNGDPVTSKDFAYSWKRTLDPKTKAQYAFMVSWIKGGAAYNAGKGTADQVAIETPDDNTLKVTLDQPRAYFLNQMAFPVFFALDQKVVEKYGDKYAADADKYVSNGPFKLTSWVHEQTATLEKNADYWDAANVKLNKVNFVMVKDSNASLNLYESGDLDQKALAREQVDNYKNSPELTTLKLPTVWYLQYNQRVPALKNAKIRQALTYAIDAQQFVDVTLGNGSVPATGITPWGIADGNGGEYQPGLGDVMKRKENLDKAKQLLQDGMKEAGLTSFPKIKFLTQDSTTAKKQAEFIQEQWRQHLGVTIDVEQVPFKLKTQRQTAKDFDIIEAGWSPDYNDPMTFLDMWVTNGDFNDNGWSNKQYDDLIAKVHQTADPKARLDLMHQAETLLMQEMPIGPLNFDGSKRLIKPYVKDLIMPNFGPEWDLKYTYVQGKK